ncbi:MAG: cell wall hydrolase [Clostridia bacterium]|nr:cell wall hydrolase [Clostridia bacterium]
MKNVKIFTAFFLIVLIFGTVASAQVGIVVDGKALAAEIPPFIENGSTYLSVHSIGDMLGAESVSWNADDRSVTVLADGAELKLIIGSDTAYIDGEAILTTTPAIIRNDRSYLPVRFVSETLGAGVAWDDSTKTVYITFANDTNDETLLWLARIVHIESGNEGYEGKLAVANVILNRVKSPKFPDTVYDVIFQPNQFPPAASGALDNLTPNDGCYAAAADALNGVNNVGDSLYFCAGSQVETSWVANNRTFYAQIGNHCFYY